MNSKIMRLLKIFVVMTIGLVGLLLGRLWGIVPLEPVVLARIMISYGLITGLLFVLGIAENVRSENPKNKDGDTLID